jgi:hypothetical protein
MAGGHFMDTLFLQKHFAAMGARLKVHQDERPSTPWRVIPPLAIDVKTDKRGEFYEIALGVQPPEVKLLQIQPQARHLLLLTEVGDRFLCGHDERHWFVAAIDSRVSTVQEAKQSLMPETLRTRVGQLPFDEIDNRRNGHFLRQGEWFFVPVDRQMPDWLILKDEPLQRNPRSKPHLCEELYREGGQRVYIVNQKRGRKAFSETEYLKRKEQNPDFDQFGVQIRVANPTVFVRGTVRHADHATIHLRGWHRVLLNDEKVSDMVRFLD